MNRSATRSITTALAALALALGGMFVAKVAALFAPPEYDVVSYTVMVGDTWWELGATCDGNRQMAMSFLAERSGLDTNSTLHPGTPVYVCAGVDQ